MRFVFAKIETAYVGFIVSATYIYFIARTAYIKLGYLPSLTCTLRVRNSELVLSLVLSFSFAHCARDPDSVIGHRLPFGRNSPKFRQFLSSASDMSDIRQNFSKECEDAINEQINLELHASYVYLSMAYHFDRQDVALPGISRYFKRASDDEREHAMKLMAYQNKRGGEIVLSNISAPEKADWGTAKDAMSEALILEKRVNESLLDLHVIASNSNDANLQDFLDTEFLQEQVDSIKEIADHVTNLERVGEGLGVYLFDQRINDTD